MTETHKYTAPNGHVIYGDPTYQTSGQGRVRILNRDQHSFDFEITAFKDTFTVYFTSYERWMQSSANGDFEYPKSVFEYMADLRTVIEQRLIDDEPPGTFDVIQFLKDLRSGDPQAYY